MSRMETKVVLVGHGRAERKTNGSAVSPTSVAGAGDSALVP